MLRFRTRDGHLAAGANAAGAGVCVGSNNHAAAAMRRLFLMDYDVGIPMPHSSTVNDNPSSVSPSLHEDASWQMTLRSREMDSGSYPIREGEPNCSYYIRTGLCRFGSSCRFNHPRDRNLAIAAAQMKGEYPQRVGRPECEYYLKTGACKFGPTCKFDHPKDKAEIAQKVELNVLGYPFRPNETECAYYLRTGQCKFGSTCKFHHPQPSNVASSSNHPLDSSTPNCQQSYQSVTNWPMPKASVIASPRWQGFSSYAPLVLPPGVVSVPRWNAYSSDAPNTGSQETFPVYHSGSIPIRFFALQRENAFPERPGQPDCQFYMKTGDCKFGTVCRFHHPRERLISSSESILSPIGLPLRPGEPLCVFYSRYGICKFGPSCKFDHPMGVFTYTLSASSSGDAPVVRRLMGSSSATGGLALTAEGVVGSGPLKLRTVSSSDSRHIPSADDDINDDG